MSKTVAGATFPASSRQSAACLREEPATMALCVQLGWPRPWESRAHFPDGTLWHKEVKSLARSHEAGEN